MQLNLYEHICWHIVTKNTEGFLFIYPYSPPSIAIPFTIITKGVFLKKTQHFPVLFFGVVVEKSGENLVLGLWDLLWSENYGCIKFLGKLWVVKNFHNFYTFGMTYLSVNVKSLKIWSEYFILDRPIQKCKKLWKFWSEYFTPD
jgi:hypothetical protein